MSYNVSDVTIQQSDGFKLSIEALEQLAESKPSVDGDQITFDDFDVEQCVIRGTRDGDYMTVEEVEYFGIGSGGFFDDFRKLLAHSTGTLVLRVVWEGGDTIEVLTVQDGVTTVVKQ